MGLLESQNEGIRHRAAKDIIEFVQKGMELDDLAKRMDSIEASLKKRQSN